MTKRPPAAPPPIAAFLLFVSSAAARAAPRISILGAGVCDGVGVGERVGLAVGENDTDGVTDGVVDKVGVDVAEELGLVEGPAASLNDELAPVYELVPDVTVICAEYVEPPFGLNVLGSR